MSKWSTVHTTSLEIHRTTILVQSTIIYNQLSHMSKQNWPNILPKFFLSSGEPVHWRAGNKMLKTNVHCAQIHCRKHVRSYEVKWMVANGEVQHANIDQSQTFVFKWFQLNLMQCLNLDKIWYTNHRKVRRNFLSVQLNVLRMLVLGRDVGLSETLESGFLHQLILKVKYCWQTQTVSRRKKQNKRHVTSWHNCLSRVNV